VVPASLETARTARDRGRADQSRSRDHRDTRRCRAARTAHKSRRLLASAQAVRDRRTVLRFAGNCMAGKPRCDASTLRRTPSFVQSQCRARPSSPHSPQRPQPLTPPDGGVADAPFSRINTALPPELQRPRHLPFKRCHTTSASSCWPSVNQPWPSRSQDQSPTRRASFTWHSW